MSQIQIPTPTGKRVGIIVAVILFILLMSKSIVVVPAGHVGVKVLFGNVAEKTLDAGMHIVNPLVKVHDMTVRTQQISEDAKVPSKEGLIVNLDITVLYSLNSREASEVYKTIGLDYENVIIVPLLRSVVRGVTAGYEAKALYTAEREALANQMMEQLKPMVEKRGINLEKVMLRSVKLPDILATAIEKKLEAEQQSEQMKFVLAREKQEAERKRIEAKGISDYNREVAQSLTKEIIQLRGIEATNKLAESSNSKIVIAGGRDGLPVILGSQ
jgi:regulator of protease activity HflC (stomatin/prohibitin superfamily)